MALLIEETTNQTESPQIKSNQIKCRVLVRGENQSTWKKVAQSRVDNQQTQSTYVSGSGNQTWAILVQSDSFYQYPNPALIIRHECSFYRFSLAPSPICILSFMFHAKHQAHIENYNSWWSLQITQFNEVAWQIFVVPATQYLSILN